MCSEGSVGSHALAGTASQTWRSRGAETGFPDIYSVNSVFDDEEFTENTLNISFI
jgi:hypothetical protein